MRVQPPPCRCPVRAPGGRAHALLLLLLTLLLLGPAVAQRRGPVHGGADWKAKKQLLSSKRHGVHGGEEMVQQGGGGITRVAVIGERHSGTNFMGRFLARNLATQHNVSETFCAYKHRAQVPGPECPPVNKTLVVVMFRNPYDWALGMHARCYCTPEWREVAKTPFAEFVHMPILDTSAVQAPKDAPPQDPPIGFFADLFECRNARHRNFLNISAWAPNVEYVRHEDVLDAQQQEAWMSRLLTKYKLQPSAEQVKSVTGYKERDDITFDADTLRAKSPWLNRALGEADAELAAKLSLVTKGVDAELEAEIGYSPLIE
ncbi:hypothetical protein FOA52_003810 [Chlamydomonas sp. UWO 241]|nr:hypothetical protein FOA52_003810 [Chlamydomonas sp. UWO 241]